ncbi:MAG: hypothetical protein VW397_00315 [Candidatus Margulisiibacteriota bacterium]
MVNRYQFIISYQGGKFKGSQKQVSDHTVFNSVEQALNQLFKVTVRCIPAGRTDSRVSAAIMHFHVDLDFTFNEIKVLKRLNRSLVKVGIFIRSIQLVSSEFHALSSAKSRTYTYFFTFDSTIPHYLLDTVAYLDQDPQFIPSTEQLRSIFCGRRNFRYLSNVSDSKSTIRTIFDVHLTCNKYQTLFGESIDIFTFKITADGFLYRMIRHIVGLLLHSMVNFTNIRYLKDYLCVHRAINYSLAPAEGLHLSGIKY